MTINRLFAIAISPVLLISSCTNSPKQEIKNMTETQTQQPSILFVCEHGSAKSIVAATHFNRLAREQNLNMRAISRGTSPDETLPPKVIQGLQAHGLEPVAPKPTLLAGEDVTGASRVVTFCELPNDYDKLAKVERWNEVPPISEDMLNRETRC